jgi:hypothetical protein
MSANRSVQAAQRRRTGPPDAGIPGRGPQPSINSAQMFANQAKPGQGPSMPTGRMAGQQAALQQQQHQQQAYQQGQKQKEGISSVSKMTVPQAITLITLRLGAIESKLINMPETHSVSSMDENFDIDSGTVQTIMSRLESLEKRSASSNGTVSTPELNLLKQQFETIKQAVVQSKGATTSLVKENVSFKTQVENLRKELTETKELLAALQNLTMDNSQKILELSVNDNVEYMNAFIEQPLDEFTDELTDELTDKLNNFSESNAEFTHLKDLEETYEQNEIEIVGADLKQLIESELNTN